MSGRVTVPAFLPAWIEWKMDVLFITNLFIYIMVERLESDLGKAESTRLDWISYSKSLLR